MDWRVAVPWAFRRVASVVVAVSALYTYTEIRAGCDIPLPEDRDRIMPPLEKSLSKKGRDKAKALANYAVAYVKLRTDGEFSEVVVNRLLETVRRDPFSRTPLKLLFAKWKLNNEPEKLIEALLPIAKANPTAIDLNALVANSMRLDKRSDEALELLEASAKAAKLGDDSPVPLLRRVELARAILGLYANKKRWSDGEDFCDDLLDDDDAANSYFARLAAAEFLAKCADQGPDGFFSGWSKRRRRSSLEKNLKALDKLADKEDVRAGDLPPLIGVYKRYSMPERAEKILLSRLLAHPHGFRTLVLLAKTYDDFNMHPQASRAWRMASAGSDDPRAVLVLREVLKEPDAEQWMFRYKEGLAALEAGWFERAVEAFNWCLADSPGNVAAILQIGYAYMREGKNVKAIKSFERIEKGVPSASYLKAVCLDRIGKYSEAFDAMGRAESGFLKNTQGAAPPPSKEFWLEYAVIADRAKQRVKEEEVLEKVLEKYPDDPDVNNFLGYVWADWNKNLEKAEKLIAKALEKEPDNAAYLDSMAWALYRQGKFNDALEYIEKAIVIDSPLPDAVLLDHAGDINAAAGNKKKAVELWKKALTTYNEDLDRGATRKKIAEIEPETAECAREK